MPPPAVSTAPLKSIATQTGGRIARGPRGAKTEKHCDMNHFLDINKTDPQTRSGHILDQAAR